MDAVVERLIEMEKRAKEAMRENYEYYPDCDAPDRTEEVEK